LKAQELAEMSKRKGMSAEDKRKTTLLIYHEKMECFNLKEMESLATKAGVVAQTVKDVNQSLVDDGMVLMDKIGAGNFFWSFPSKLFLDSTRQIETLKAFVPKMEASIEEKKLALEELRKTRSLGPERLSKMARLEACGAREAEVERELASRKANDPEELKRIKAFAMRSKRAGERWTDNIYSIKQYMTKKKGMNSKEVDKFIGIDGNFDYPEYISNSKKPRK